MRKIRVIVLAVAVVFAAGTVIYAGSGSKRKKKGSAHAAIMPEATGAAVWQFITKARPYQQWQLFPGKGKLYKGSAPHGAFLTTYVNAPAHAALTAHTTPLPEGSIIVKENYKPDKTLAAITVMMKKKGYNPDAGDWFWAKYGPDGSIMKEGKVASCIGCHGAAKVRDYVMTQ